MQNPSVKQLNEVFTVRKKTGPYSLIPLEVKCQLMQEFGKEPYPNKKKLKALSKKFGVVYGKLTCWYQYYQKKLLREKNPSDSNKKHRFDKKQLSILENSFLRSSTLNSELLDHLKKMLSCPDIYIKRWFSYRNKKLRIIQENEKNTKHTPEVPIKIKNENKSEEKAVEEILKTEFNHAPVQTQNSALLSPLNANFSSQNPFLTNVNAFNYFSNPFFGQNMNISPMMPMYYPPPTMPTFHPGMFMNNLFHPKRFY